MRLMQVRALQIGGGCRRVTRGERMTHDVMMGHLHGDEYGVDCECDLDQVCDSGKLIEVL